MNQKRLISLAVVIIVVLGLGAVLFLVTRPTTNNNSVHNNTSTNSNSENTNTNNSENLKVETGKIFKVNFEYNKNLGQVTSKTLRENLETGELYCLSETFEFDKAALEVSFVFGAPECAGSIGGAFTPLDGQNVGFSLYTFHGGDSDEFVAIGARSTTFAPSNTVRVIESSQQVDGKFFISINTNSGQIANSSEQEYTEYIKTISNSINVDTESLKSLVAEETN